MDVDSLIGLVYTNRIGLEKTNLNNDLTARSVTFGRNGKDAVRMIPEGY